jgi:ABC-2 type transport system ATP-binding protein
MIILENLTKAYGSHTVLDTLSLSLPAGRVYGIAGENGSGKTTLFRCICGLENFSGSIRYDQGNLKDHTGFLPTDPYFFSRITGEEYIRLICNARNKPTGDMDRRNIFGLPLGQYASTYSTGMKKKLALTAILMQENDVYILDEPFNGVDIHSNMLITGIIGRLRELNKTVLISSHIFSTLNDTCDEIHLLREGRFVQKAERAGFAALESEMKTFTIGSKLNDLGLV